MARKENAAKKNEAPKAKSNGTFSAEFQWKIKGTDHFGSTKEELKAKRRELNAAAGIHEVETKVKDQILPANPSNTWPYRITKGPAHPHNRPAVVAAKHAPVLNG